MGSEKRPVSSTLKRPTLPDSAWGALLVIGVLIAYIPAMHGDFVWDDDAYVIENQNLRSLSGLRAIWFDIRATPQYYPLVHTTYWFEFHIWELTPTGYHVVNIVLHACNAILLWRILVYLQIPGAWMCAAVFALHPVHVESVAWITERKNVLSGLFYLSSAYCYLRFALPKDALRHATRTWYAAALALFLCALLSKTVTASLPAALALVLWWKRGHLEKRDWLSLTPMFVVGAAFGLITAWLERDHVGARGPEWDFTFVERCLIASRALWFYLVKLLMPVNLIFIYPRWQIDPMQAWQYIFPLGCVVLLLVLWFARKRIGLAPLVAALSFGGTLLPALGFLNVFPMRYSFVADHFQYLASIGPITLIIAYLTTILQKPGLPRHLRAGTGGGLLLMLGMLTWTQEMSYLSMETLWRDTLARNPQAAIAHHGLGYLHDLRGEQAHFGADSETARREWALAEDHYLAAVDIDERYWEAYYDLALMQLQQNRNEEAISNLTKACVIQPNHLLLRDTLGNALIGTKRIDQAYQQFDVMLKLAPHNAQAHYGMAVVMRERGNNAALLHHLREALQLKPDYGKARELLHEIERED